MSTEENSPRFDGSPRTESSAGTLRGSGDKSFTQSMKTDDSMPLLDPKDVSRASSAFSAVRKTKWWVVVMLLAVEAFERWCFYTLAGTVSQIATIKFDKSPASAKSLANAFSMVVYLMPLIGGAIADNLFGNMWTTAGCCCFYICGMVLVSIGAGTESQVVFFIGLYAMISMGTGLKAVLMNLAADQIIQKPQQTDKEFAATRQVFFNSWYACIQVGSLIANMLMTTIATQGLGPIPEDKGFMWAYIIAGVVFAMGFAMFVIACFGLRKSSMKGRCWDKSYNKKESPIKQVWNSVWQSAKKG